MEAFIVIGGQKLRGSVKVSGSKNVALKALVAACLTKEKVIIENIPHITDIFTMVDIMKELGADIKVVDHTMCVQMKQFKTHQIPLDDAIKTRTSAMFIAPLLARLKKAIIPNPGGCRLGARPIDRIVEGLKALGVDIIYQSDDGYFHAKTKGLKGTTYTFKKNTHTGTETLILAAVLASGVTVLKNAAEEPEIDDLIALLNNMGAQVQRSEKREITIQGVAKLHGTTFRISSDRNEIITFAIAALVTKGEILVANADQKGIEEFLSVFKKAGGGYEIGETTVRFYYKEGIKPTDIITAVYPGFMTDWQAPWAVLMTQANGISTIHETVFENKMGYVSDLLKMGAKITTFKPKVDNPQGIYNFNLADDRPEYIHAIRIVGPTKLHNAVLTTIDIRAGAAVILAALCATGKSTIFGVEKLDRGYEQFAERLTKLGAHISREEV